MNKYTAEDFKNARFAERGDRAAVRRMFGGGRVWSEAGATWSDQDMADDGSWVPVPTKPTITEDEFKEIEASWGVLASVAWLRGFAKAGGAIIPDPEPTNAEKLEALITEKQGWAGDLAEYLDANGVKAGNS